MTGVRRCILAIVLGCAAWPLHALEIALPASARETASRDSALDQESVPVGPYADGALPTVVIEGAVTRRAYRLVASTLTPLQILAPIRAQLEAENYEVLLDCDTGGCGGFDFRFAIDVLPAPNMYVNIRDFHFFSARQPGTDAAVTVLASAASGAGYLQIVQIGSATNPPQPPVLAVRDAVVDTSGASSDLAARLVKGGHAVLHDLDFALGATSLNQQSSPDLAAIAALLQARPGLRIAVVGHTDTVGGLDANISVSRARAQAVRAALIDTYDAPGARIEAEGMGYLSPIASNLTPAGREANRRVEVIVVSDDG